MPVFKEATGVKYPFMEIYTEQLMNMFWKFDSVELGKDVEDYNTSTPEVRKFIDEVMLLFTGNEVLVEEGYNKMGAIFKPREIVNWCTFAGSTEVTHEKAYSLFTETMNISDSVYTDFLDINVMKTKATYVDKAKVRKWEDYKAMGLSDAEVDNEFRRAVARMLAVYGGFTENVSLFAQFAMLLAFQFEGKFPGLCTIVDYSIKDENVHHIGNCHLFRTYISENQDIWDDDLKYDIYEAAREMVSYEEALIDYLNPPHLSNDDCKRYVHYQADNALKEMGMKANWGVEDNPFPFMDEVTGTILTDFFSGKVTSYSRKMLGSREVLRNKLQVVKEGK